MEHIYFSVYLHNALPCLAQRAARRIIRAIIELDVCKLMILEGQIVHILWNTAVVDVSLSITFAVIDDASQRWELVYYTNTLLIDICDHCCSMIITCNVHCFDFLHIDSLTNPSFILF